MRGLLSLLLVLSALGAACKPHQVHRVAIRQMHFDPAELTIEAGDSIVWSNEDFVNHTVTADDKRFDSKDIGANASWSLRLDRTGDHPYGCTLHPTMKARIVVK